MSEPQDHLSSEARRKFLAKATGVAAGALAPGVFLQTVAHATPRDTAVTDDVRYGMLIDTTKCADGCNDCVTACEEENGLDKLVRPAGADDESWDLQRPVWIRTVKVQNNLTGNVTNLPMMCQHCEHPPCVDVCPTGASFRRLDGIVMVDRHTCIGCRYCMMACPYNARTFIHEAIDYKPTLAPRGKGCVESCNLCVHRRDNGGTTTACQDACEHDAIVFGDLRDPNSAVSQAMAKQTTVQIRADLGLNTGVRYTEI